MAVIRHPFGRAYEDFEVGDIYKHWPGRTITDYDDTAFSLLALNQHPLHIDAHYASRTQFGKNLVNGTLVFAVTVGLTVADVSGAAIAMLEYENVKHVGPTFHGDTIYAQTEVLDKWESRSKNDRGIVYVETTTTNQHGEAVMVFRRKILVPKKEHYPDLHTFSKR